MSTWTKHQTLKSVSMWEVEMPPPANSLKGHIMPKSLMGSRKRRISVELHVGTENDVLTGLRPSGSNGHDASTQRVKREFVIVRILKKYNKKNKKSLLALKKTYLEEDDDSDADSISTVGFKGVEDSGIEIPEIVLRDTEHSANDQVEHDQIQNLQQKEWTQKYNFTIRCVAIKRRVSNVCVVSTRFRTVEQTREINFDTESAAKEFCELIEFYKKQDEKHAKDTLRRAYSSAGKKVEEGEKMKLLIEIISAWDLRKADALGHSDPYVVVRANDEVVHKTDHISNTLAPIWTINSGSLFILETTPKEFFMMRKGLLFEVKDFDKFLPDSSLGLTWFLPSELFNSNEHRIERRLQTPPSEKKEAKGYIAIRCRHATENDVAFMKEYNLKKEKQRKLEITKKIEPEQFAMKSIKGPLPLNIIQKYSKIDKDGKKLYRARPNPDRDNFVSTEWMAKEKIEELKMKDSRYWIDAGSGQVGRVDIEVIGCDDLPNLDNNLKLDKLGLPSTGDKTDAFVCILFEDSSVYTDIIDNCLSPRWMPWSRRAVSFRIMNPCSQINVGVFDYDKMKDHDFVGRVGIELTNFSPGVVYNLIYPLYTSSIHSTREKRGSIHVRLKIEYNGARTFLLSNLQYPTPNFYNVKTRRDYKIIRQTCHGKFNMTIYSLRTIYCYIEELMSYLYFTVYVETALLEVILWRGHYEVRVRVPKFPGYGSSLLDRLTRQITLLLPLHSLSAFLLGIILVERPFLFPSVFFASVSWLLLGTNGYRRLNPNPWDQCKSFNEIISLLLFNKSIVPEPIEVEKKLQEMKSYEEKWKIKFLEAERAYEERLLEYGRVQEENEIEMEGNIASDITGESSGGSSMALFKQYLFPVQQYLALTCDILRAGRRILMWEEAYYSFWLCFCSLILSIIFFFVPWRFLCIWGARVIVWTLLGPWMKLIDVFYFKPKTEEEEAKEQELKKKLREEATNIIVREARMKKENAFKLKDIKTYMFGKFINRVPVIKLDRFRDIPTSKSFACPQGPMKLTLGQLAMKEKGKNCTRIDGQNLIGEMIPVREKYSLTEVQVGEHANHTDLLDKDAPEANLVTGGSTEQAIIIISGVIGSIGILSWKVVPYLIEGVQWLTQQPS